ncbi:hypothetical protein [Paenibacillus sp. Soil724D2]|uniref:hypothetical protein n=1 Tax=Paenibacillus sp. (strain Soil724D2) TaxID=1736392 RepID=UPI0007161358|nr:hypothetical protein [Paenibacillus sp. Soil724D2]KRE37363.1 hypothetical protein ASG85_35840 [Paenibacillus sp. Soil724D2]
MGTRKWRQTEIASDFTLVEDLLIELLLRFSPQLNAKLLQLQEMLQHRRIHPRDAGQIDEDRFDIGRP